MSCFFNSRECLRCVSTGVFLFLQIAPLCGQKSAVPWSITGVREVLALAVGQNSQIALGPSGDIYLAGQRDQFDWLTPTKSFGDTSKWVNYVSRIDATGKIVFATALGGTFMSAIRVDPLGDVFLSGAANNTGFYTTPGAYRSSAPTDYSQFVCKLRGSDGDLQYCTYLDFRNSSGGAGFDKAGNFVVVGGFTSAGVATPGALNMGRNNIYVAKLNAAGSKLLYGATFGSSGTDYPDYSTVDAAGNVYITGRTFSSDFPTSANAVVKSFTPTLSLPVSSFVAKLNANGTSLVYATLGAPGEQPAAIAFDPSGNAQILYADSAGKIGVRRYSSGAPGILFETSLDIVRSYSGNGRMAIDSLGITTVLGSIGDTNLPLLHPSQSCQFTSMPVAFENGYMMRLAADGSVQQSTYLQGSGSPLFGDMIVGASSLTIALWSVNATPDLSFTDSLELITVAPGSELQLACLGNAASPFGAPLAPGEIISLFGQRIGPSTPMIGYPDSSGRYPSSLGGAEVTFDGAPAPLLYASDRQINTIVPFGAVGVLKVCVRVLGNSTNCMDARIRATSPGIFTLPITPGMQGMFAAAVNQNGTVNSERNPAPRGSIISLYATGLGNVTPAAADGTVTGPPLHTQALAIEVATPSLNPRALFPIPVIDSPVWAGQAPFEVAGLNQVNVRIPQIGNQFTLRIRQPGVSNSYWYSNTVLVWVVN